MLNWIKKHLLKLRPTFGKTTPVIPRKFPRLKTLDSRVAAARGIEYGAVDAILDKSPIEQSGEG